MYFTFMSIIKICLNINYKNLSPNLHIKLQKVINYGLKTIFIITLYLYFYLISKERI